MTLPASYFDRLYEQSADPWSLASRWYEQRKYALTLASLPQRRYHRAIEAGCSVGVLTALLAARCDSLLAVDVAAAAVAAARRRLNGAAGVEVRQLDLCAAWPAGPFDLVVMSEVGYYLDRVALTAMVERAVDSLDDGGSLVAVHWRHAVADYPLRGDAVHGVLRADSRLSLLAHHEEADFLLDVFTRGPLVSVGTAAGLDTDESRRV